MGMKFGGRNWVRISSSDLDRALSYNCLGCPIIFILNSFHQIHVMMFYH